MGLTSDSYGGGSFVNGEGTAAIRAILDQHAVLVTNFNLLLAKLDLDAPDTGGDNDYGTLAV